MKERETPSDPYYQHDVAIETPPSYELLGGFGFRFKIHRATERYGRSHEDLVKLTGPGTRSYFHGKPYQLIADHHLTVDLFAVPPPTGEIGTVEESRWEGFRHQEIGNAQGWYYPEHRTLVLWESFLEQRFRGGPPYEDTLHLLVWHAWERFLVEHSPGVERIVTTWEDEYPRDEWQLFLEGQGYRQMAPASFAKEVTRPRGARKIVEAEHHYRGYDADGGVCRVEIYAASDRPPLIVATELPENPVASITNMAEYLAAEVMERYLTDADLSGRQPPFLWIEHYPRTAADRRIGLDDGWAQVTFAHYRREQTRQYARPPGFRYRLGIPSRDSLSRDRVAELLWQYGGSLPTD